MITNPLLSKHLETFITVAEVKSTHAASKSLNITQTAVTKRIKNFEQMLGSLLFSRSPLGMELTHAGEQILDYCYSIKNLSAELLAGLNKPEIKNTFNITISGPYSVMKARIAPVITHLMKKNPEYRVRLDIHHNDIFHVDLSGNHLAIIPISSISNELSAKKIQSEYYHLYATADWKHRSLQEILRNEVIIDIDDKDTLTHQYLAHYHQLNNASNNRLFANNTEILNEMIHNGIGYGVISSELRNYSSQDEKLYLLNDGLALENKLALVWHKCNTLPEHMKRIIDIIN